MENVENPAYVRMRYFSRKLDFTPEPLQRLVLPGNVLPNYFYSDVFIEFEILRLINFAHAAPGNEANNSETTRKELARDEA
jgi:hypothetical protein